MARFISQGVRDEDGRWIAHPIIECLCGNEVLLDLNLNTCTKCVADYNGFGQLLAPRQQWGEETGECLADILTTNPSEVT